MTNLYLKEPKQDDLFYRQKWMNDPDTMRYNAGYDMELKGYNKQTGTINKTTKEMLEWFDKWIDKEPDRFYAYIFDSKIDEPIGEVYYYLDGSIYSMGILICNKYRGNGYSKKALQLLCKKAKENGIKELNDEFEIDRNNTLKVFESVGFKIDKKINIEKFGKQVDGVRVKIEL